MFKREYSHCVSTLISNVSIFILTMQNKERNPSAIYTCTCYASNYKTYQGQVWMSLQIHCSINSWCWRYSTFILNFVIFSISSGFVQLLENFHGLLKWKSELQKLQSILLFACELWIERRPWELKPEIHQETCKSLLFNNKKKCSFFNYKNVLTSLN